MNKNKLKYILVSLYTILLLNVNNISYAILPKKIVNPVYDMFESFFWIIAIPILLVAAIIYYIKQKDNPKRIKSVIRMIIFGTIIIGAIYVLGLSIIPEYK